ncbi:MAG TPA: polysaccharide deacetylase family protein [Candidatus Methylomirabilis sp.]
MPTHEPGRHCKRCGEIIRWNAARFIGLRPFCSEPCAILWLSDEASRTAWDRAALEMDRRSHNLRHRVRRLRASWRASVAQRRLDRRLDAGPRAEDLPWIWLPSPRGAAALLLVLIAWAAAGGPAPETRAMIPLAPPPAPPAIVAVAPPEPAPPSPPPAPPPPRAVVSPSPPPAERPAPTRPRPLPRVVADDITRGDLTVREVAFTFDGGDEANVAGEILDILWARRIQTTIFLTGQFIRIYPDLVRRMVGEGHEVGNHTDAHPHLTTYEKNHRQQTLPNVTREFLVGQLRRAEESFRRLTGQAMAPYWRAPYGEHNTEIRAWAAEAGYRHISWTRGAGTAEDLDTRDWVADRSSRIYRSREEIATRILEFGRGRPEGLNGGVVLMHLASHRKTDRPHEGLPQLLRTLQGQGYRIVTVSELLDSLPGGQRSATSAATPLPAPDGRSPAQ